MPWIQLKKNTTGANAEEISDALMESGAVSVTFRTPRHAGVRAAAG
ncbi:hypothetical protein [Cronobacter sakazakii]